MENLNLDLLFFDIGPDGPIAIVQVKFSGGITRADGSHDRLISSNCLNPGELDREIDRLQGELEWIRTNGKKMFAKAA